jgi:hypothetical protein
LLPTIVVAKMFPRPPARMKNIVQRIDYPFKRGTWQAAGRKHATFPQISPWMYVQRFVR